MFELPTSMNEYVRTILCGISTLILSGGFMTSTFAQEVSIPDPGLNAAIREALQNLSGH